jgi:hypothetical protein
LLLDGHVRLEILRELGQTETRCLISDDDEAFTYNKRINRLATIQEHYMIVRALKRGVSPDKLARALNVDVRSIQRKRGLLEGICQDVVELLKDRSVNPVTFEVLRKMKPMRQIEVGQSDLVRGDKPKRVAGMTPEQMARMEREMASLTQDFKALETSYGDDVLQLVIASGYLSKLIANPEIDRYLRQRHPELLEGFQSIVAAASLDQSGGGGAALA